MAQNGQEYTGLRCSDERYESLSILPLYSGEKYNEIPLRMSLRKHCPIAGNQGRMGSCVGWAVGYGALTISRAIQNDLHDISTITAAANSAAYIYNQVKLPGDYCTSGAYIEDALHLLQQQGDCLEQTFNFVEGNCKMIPSKEAIAEAQFHRIADYAALFPLGISKNEKSALLCKTLAARVPVIVGLQVSSSFWQVKPGQKKWLPQKGEPANGFHAMVVIGYDNIEKEFELLNSFGPTWGDQGIIRMSYDDLTNRCRYAYVCTLPEQQVELVKQEDVEVEAYYLKGSFVFRKPVGYITLADGRETPFFEEVTTQFNPENHIYTLSTGHQQVGDIFQLVAREIPTGHFAYVFSQAPDKRVNLHFPKSHQANFFLSNQAEVAIPGEETVLQLSHKGYDHLCILYSTKKILDIEQRLLELETSTEPFPVAFQEVFNDVLIPASRILWEADKMEFTAAPVPAQQQYVAPIILQVYAE